MAGNASLLELLSKMKAFIKRRLGNFHEEAESFNDFTEAIESYRSNPIKTNLVDCSWKSTLDVLLPRDWW